MNLIVVLTQIYSYYYESIFGKRFPDCVQVTYFHRISLTPSLIEVPVSSQESEWSDTCVSGKWVVRYMCIRGIDFVFVSAIFRLYFQTEWIN